MNIKELLMQFDKTDNLKINSYNIDFIVNNFSIYSSFTRDLLLVFKMLYILIKQFHTYLSLLNYKALIIITSGVSSRTQK